MNAAIRGAVRALLVLFALLWSAHADPVLPGNILDPKTPAEAWNVIRLATSNVDRLLQENRLGEIPIQIAYCSPSLRALGRLPESADRITAVQKPVERALGWVTAVASAGIENDAARTASALGSLRSQLDLIAQQYDPKAVAADIYFCPMHPDFISEQAATPCAKCGMTLVPRRIPYSFIYTAPGQPTIRMTAKMDGTVVSGKKAVVTVKLTQNDGSPVKLEDLMVMHSKPIHLLIEDPGLQDYHHEHPTPTGTPGEYQFSFVPKLTAPYRIWADLVPVTTGIQELPFVDLPCEAKGQPIADTADRFESEVDGLHFSMKFSALDGSRARAGKVCGLQIRITDAQGQPLTRLEPVMNAFAHLVGFYDDFHTVVHLHPTGGDILDPGLRGGPALGFKFYPPKAGFLRLYCQVMLDGGNIFAPFNVNIAP